MDNLTPEQLEQAQTKLINQTRQARGDLDYLTRELSRMVIGNALGNVMHDEIKAVRLQIAESIQVMEETPAALAILKELIGKARSKVEQEGRMVEAAQTLQDYFSVRQEIIDNPKLADNQVAAGKLNGLVSRLDRDVANGRLQKRETSFVSEREILIASALEYSSRNRSEPFSFNVLIPE